MYPEPPDADTIADQLLPLDGPYDPDRVIEAARTIRELVRRLNHATRSRTALRYPPQLNRTTDALTSALAGLGQTFTQLAQRLDTFATDPRVAHERRHDPGPVCREAAIHLRDAAAALPQVTTPLREASLTGGVLGYDTHTTVEPSSGPATPNTTPPAPPSPTRRRR